MKVIYKEDIGEMHLVEAVEFVGIIMYVPIGIRLLSIDIERDIPLDIATKLFQRWHQIDQGAEPEIIARALNDALNFSLVVYAESKNEGHPFRDACILYQKGEFKFKNIMLMIDDTELLNKRISNIKHNITEDRVEYFIDDKLKGWLPIVRKEIAS